MKVINLFAPPSGGKSITAKMLSGLLSLAGKKVEYVPEFAKFEVLAKRNSSLDDQIFMFANQENKLHILNKLDLDYVVMDGPLPLALLFHRERHYQHFEGLVMEVFNDFENINFYLNKQAGIPYEEFGREQTAEESEKLGATLRMLLAKHNVNYEDVTLSPSLPHFLLKKIIDSNQAPLPVDPVSLGDVEALGS